VKYRNQVSNPANTIARKATASMVFTPATFSTCRNILLMMSFPAESIGTKLYHPTP
jgi:hypothetical protein